MCRPTPRTLREILDTLPESHFLRRKKILKLYEIKLEECLNSQKHLYFWAKKFDSHRPLARCYTGSRRAGESRPRGLAAWFE